MNVNPVNENELERAEAITLLLLGRIRRLYIRGLTTWLPGVIITPAGLASFDQVEASGFRPTPEEMRAFCRSFGATPKDAEGLEILLREGGK